MTIIASRQKYRMRTKEQIEEETHKEVLAQASEVLGGDGLEGMLRNLGTVGLQAMLEASGMSRTTPGTDGLACAKQVRPPFPFMACPALLGPLVYSQSVLLEKYF